ncbi:MAG: hypothetical protein E7172_02330 [Firmicutes bacterium]|nr:hypothetical protein [Bacillota bacterium]
MAKKKVKDKISYKKEVLDLKEFMLLDAKKQFAKIEKILKDIYEDTLDVTSKHVDKVLNICFDVTDSEVFLPHNLKVEKHGSRLIFDFAEKNNLGLFLLFLFAFLFAGIAATYSGVTYLNSLKINIDLDGDGVADLNIDLDGDGVCDINCDEDGDEKPDKNIDYKSNREAIFNILREDGTVDNPINQDKTGDGICDINCDTNDDGWPDLNIDYDGDGKVDIDMDTDGDGIKDTNLDTDSDGVCDINCDEDKDGVCDRNCANIDIPDNGEGTSSETGDGGIDFSTTSLIVMFESMNRIDAHNIFPDDHTEPELNTKIPDLKFTVENTTDGPLYYDINWIVNENTFESSNFWYKITSDLNGYKSQSNNIGPDNLNGWVTAPKNTETFATNIEIPAHSKQSYVVSMTLHGTNEEQNYDQNKHFNGRIEVKLR